MKERHGTITVMLLTVQDRHISSILTRNYDTFQKVKHPPAARPAEEGLPVYYDNPDSVHQKYYFNLVFKTSIVTKPWLLPATDKKNQNQYGPPHPLLQGRPVLPFQLMSSQPSTPSLTVYSQRRRHIRCMKDYSPKSNAGRISHTTRRHILTKPMMF